MLIEFRQQKLSHGHSIFGIYSMEQCEHSMITLFMYDLLQLEEKLDKFVTESNNSVNTELSGQLMKEKNQSMQRLEELVKEQKGKIDQLTEENNSSRQQIDELQVIH